MIEKNKLWGCLTSKKNLAIVRKYKHFKATGSYCLVISPEQPDCCVEMTEEFIRELTPQERHLWYDFLQHYPVKVYKQRIIDSFIADFYCASARLVIEVDGSQHFTAEGLLRDAARTEIIEQYDLLVVRYTNHEIDTQFDAVCNHIMHLIETRRA